MIFHTLMYFFRFLSVYSINTCFTIGINDVVASRTTTSHVFHQSSLNLTETVYEKLEKHTPSREVKLLNLLVSIRKLKCNTIFIPFVRYHLFIPYFYVSNFFYITTSTCLVPRRLSENVRAKEGGKETTAVCTLPMVPCGSSPVTRFVLASVMRKTKRLRRRRLLLQRFFVFLNVHFFLKFSHVIIISYCTLFFIYVVV